MAGKSLTYKNMANESATKIYSTTLGNINTKVEYFENKKYFFNANINTNVIGNLCTSL